jgi:phage gpG-like protein
MSYTKSTQGTARSAAMRPVLCFLLAIIAITGFAQTQQQDTTKVKNEKKEKKLYLWGYLSDSFTRTYIPDVKVVGAKRQQARLVK